MIQKPKGTYDLYGKEAQKVQYLEKLIKSLMEKYNYNYIQTPIFENSEIFHRGVGETSDIVTKETYDFKDRGNRNLTLRPEGTAGVVRSYIENKLYALNNPYKAWYFGPMFRYERPQAGRNRQFIQFGIESFGCESPLMDAEVISIMVNFFSLLGLNGIKVKLNTLGDIESRKKYRKALIDYFKPHIDDLCDDCKERYKKNPLRILDCKADRTSEIIENAPKISEYLNEKSKNHFVEVQKYLDSMEIEYEIDETIVRGLDYYTHTVFEVEANIKGFGSQNVLGAGGRYDNLVETLGGPATPAVGFAVGIDRLLIALDYENIDITDEKSLDVYMFAMSEKENKNVMSLANTLRLNGYNVEIDFMNKNIKNNFKNANKLNSKFIIIIGEEEVKTKILTVKNNKTKDEYKVKLEEIINFLDNKIGDNE